MSFSVGGLMAREGIVLAQECRLGETWAEARERLLSEGVSSLRKLASQTRVLRGPETFVSRVIWFCGSRPANSGARLPLAQPGPAQPGRDRIIAEKRDQNSRREKDLLTRLRGVMAEACMFVRGTELEIGSEDPRGRLVKGSQTLVYKVYINLPMLHGNSFTEADLGRVGRVDGGLFGAEGSGLTKAKQEVLNHAQTRLGVKVPPKALVEKFTAKPYGWTAVAALCVAASLVARSDSVLLEGNALI